MLLEPFPDIISISYVGTTDRTSSRLFLGANRLVVMEASLAKLAAMGVTIIASSGDYGWLILMSIEIPPNEDGSGWLWMALNRQSNLSFFVPRQVSST